MFLSQLTLNPRSHEVQRDLSSPLQLHKTLCRAFNGGDETSQGKAAIEAARMLFRADDDKGALHLLVQSKTAPDWTFLEKGDFKGYLRGEVRTREWSPRFTAGQALRFRLLANPTFRPKQDGRDGPRQGLFREAERLDWLRRQAARHGFELPLHEVVYRKRVCNGVEKKVVFRSGEYDELQLQLPVTTLIDLNDGPLQEAHRERAWQLPRHRAQFSAARFDGTLHVTDPEEFARAVEGGIGPGKGFGFGLLSLARA